VPLYPVTEKVKQKWRERFLVEWQHQDTDVANALCTIRNRMEDRRSRLWCQLSANVCWVRQRSTGRQFCRYQRGMPSCDRTL